MEQGEGRGVVTEAERQCLHSDRNLAIQPGPSSNLDRSPQEKLACEPPAFLPWSAQKGLEFFPKTSVGNRVLKQPRQGSASQRRKLAFTRKMRAPLATTDRQFLQRGHRASASSYRLEVHFDIQEWQFFKVSNIQVQKSSRPMSKLRHHIHPSRQRLEGSTILAKAGLRDRLASPSWMQPAMRLSLSTTRAENPRSKSHPCNLRQSRTGQKFPRLCACGRTDGKQLACTFPCFGSCREPCWELLLSILRSSSESLLQQDLAVCVGRRWLL